MSGIDRHRRKEIAREALDVGMDDPYWLCNLHGRIDEASLLETADQLREDAEVMETAFEKIDSGEWLPSEAALYIAENAHFGDYETRGHLFDSLPIEGDR